MPTRVYSLDQQSVPEPSEVVEGTIPVFHRLAKILIDPGATHSFVSPTFILEIDVKAERLPYDLEVRTPTGNQSLLANEVYRNCDIWVGEWKLVVDLISLAIKGYDVILSMDWLAHYHARVDCRMKVVEFCIPGEATLKLDVRGKANVVADALSRKAQLASLMVGKWSLLENVYEWNPRLEPRKVIFGNIEVKSTLLDQIKEGQMKEPTVQKWVERVKKGELSDLT
nr:uncharacterized protein LOC113711369 [Coffea arabica]